MSLYDEMCKLRESFLLGIRDFFKLHHALSIYTHHTNHAQSRASALSTLHFFLHRFRRGRRLPCAPTLILALLQRRGIMSSPSMAQDTAALPSQSVWDRISAWASEHKAVIYTVAGVTLVATAAGVYYYVSSAPKKDGGAEEDSSTEKRKSKKDRRKARKEVEEKLLDQSKNRTDSDGEVSSSTDNQSAAMKSPQTAVEEDEFPEITEEYVTSLNEEVCQHCGIYEAISNRRVDKYPLGTERPRCQVESFRQ